MTTSTYDPCFLVTRTKDQFGVVGMQTDDTIILADEKFSVLEEDEPIKANFTAKPKQKLSHAEPLIFNGCVLTQDADVDSMSLRQKEQGKKIKLIDANSRTFIKAMSNKELVRRILLRFVSQKQPSIYQLLLNIKSRVKMTLLH